MGQHSSIEFSAAELKVLLQFESPGGLVFHRKPPVWFLVCCRLFRANPAAHPLGSSMRPTHETRYC